MCLSSQYPSESGQVSGVLPDPASALGRAAVLNLASRGSSPNSWVPPPQEFYRIQNNRSEDLFLHSSAGSVLNGLGESSLKKSWLLADFSDALGKDIARPEELRVEKPRKPVLVLPLEYNPSEEVAEGFLTEVSFLLEELRDYEDRHGSQDATPEWLHPRTLSAWEQFKKHSAATFPDGELEQARNFIQKQLKDLFSVWAHAVRKPGVATTYLLASEARFRRAVRRGIENWIPMPEDIISLFFKELFSALRLLAKEGQYGCDWFTLKLDSAGMCLSVAALPAQRDKKVLRKKVVPWSATTT